MLARLRSVRNSLAWRVIAVLLLLVTLSIAVMAGLGYDRLYQVTEENASIRIDRAGRAAVNLFVHANDGDFAARHDEAHRPVALTLRAGDPDTVLRYSDAYDALLAQIGQTNQGAANLFRFNAETAAFDRFATTFRRPDGSMPPPMSISEGHPAYASLAANRPFIGQVPVMERMRLAYLTPIETPGGEVAGALAVDVGWADTLLAARKSLQIELFGYAALILVLFAALGVVVTQREMQPLREMAAFANAVASETDDAKAPYLDRRDEVGALAQGLGRVARLQDELQFLAYTDPLTGKGNRARYFADLTGLIGTSVAKGQSLAVMHLDIKHFARINDAFGQSAGDSVLRHVAAQISQTFDPSARIARLGGDVFSILLENPSEPETLGEICQGLVERLCEPVVLPHGEIHAQPSIGIALVPKDAMTAEEAHRSVTLALRKAKDEDVAGFSFFCPRLNEAAQRAYRLEKLLREALEQDALDIHFQPQIDPQTGALFGLEALARWNHPIEGLVSPAEFIPIAEKTGLIVELGNWMLDASCRQARLWQELGLGFNHVSVNVSPIQLWQKNFVQHVTDCLRKHGLDGRHLCLEVTESVFVDQDEARIGRSFNELKALRVVVALDDFGSGYASLGYLNRLPFDLLKIDRYFVSRADRDPQKAKLLQGMVGLGKSLGMTIVAEGAEEEGEVRLLTSLGCDAVQGFYFARPVPAESLRMTLDSIADLPRKSEKTSGKVAMLRKV